LKTLDRWDDVRKVQTTVTLNDEGNIEIVEIYFYSPIPIADFSMEKLLLGKCGGCGERNKKI